MADTKRDIVGRIGTLLREMSASNTFEACGRVVSGAGAYATLMAANAASITTLVAAYSTAAAFAVTDEPAAGSAAADPSAAAA